MTDQRKLKQKERLIELLCQTLKEIKDVNDAILSDADDTLYLSGFIDAKASAIDTVVGDRYKGDSVCA